MENSQVDIINYMFTYGQNSNQVQPSVTFDQVKQIVEESFEKITGCTLYNKPNIIESIQKSIESDETKLMVSAIESINENLIPEITFESMFKSNLDFSLVFRDPEIIVFYNNKKLDLASLDWVKTSLVETKTNYLPVISDSFVKNIITVVRKLINKDLSVKYHLKKIPTPYWNLFEIKCKKYNGYMDIEKYKYLDDIINGKFYKLDEPIQNTEPDDELKAILMQIEEFEKNEKLIKSNTFDNSKLTEAELKKNDELYRMEIMSYMNDLELVEFLDNLEKADNLYGKSDVKIKPDIIAYIKLLLEITQSSSNKMSKYYWVYRIFIFINKIEDFLTQFPGFRKSVANKINELQDELYIIQTAGLEFSKEITCTFDNVRKMIDNIEIKLNPSYVPNWAGVTTQQEILNNIVKTDEPVPKFNPNVEMVVDSDSDDDEEHIIKHNVPVPKFEPVIDSDSDDETDYDSEESLIKN